MSSSEKKMIRFKGITINPGRVLAHVCLFSVGRQKSVIEFALDSDSAVTREIERYSVAREECSQELNQLASQATDAIGKAESEIFIAQTHIMNDPQMVASITGLIKEKRRNADWAIATVLGEFEERFATLDTQYLRDRSNDITEIKRRLLSRLTNTIAGYVCEGQPHCRRGANRLIVAEELTAGMIVNMKMDTVQGFVTEHGGITSHAAILARSLGIPAITGVSGIMAHIGCADMLLINGDTGEVYLHPDKATIDALITTKPADEIPVRVELTPAGMELSANASTLEDVKQSVLLGADSIGLFRTEILFVGAERLLTENEQFAFYKNVTDVMHGRPVTFRMLDIGGDKPLPFLRMRKESNPFLGWRGARFLLGNPEIFNTQIRALGRLSMKARIKIMFPMVIDQLQMALLLARSREALDGIEHDSANISFGAMFEVPSAFIQAKEILELIDFGSIGSNDLIQYLFAIDRDNEQVSQEYNPDHPALWSFLSDLSRVAVAAGKPVSICGEMAGREGIAGKLLGTGITSLSVSPRLIPRVRTEMIRFAQEKK
ncbi:MAG: phosphoenolpyruvate--protein phosphotransferase [Chitinispirillaceae bacterium]|nr:phosphoenolpyruvate--protein phosphotransferase [Chitinispirillaceae bacterium]